MDSMDSTRSLGRLLQWMSGIGIDVSDPEAVAIIKESWELCDEDFSHPLFLQNACQLSEMLGSYNRFMVWLHTHFDPEHWPPGGVTGAQLLDEYHISPTMIQEGVTAEEFRGWQFATFNQLLMNWYAAMGGAQTFRAAWNKEVKERERNVQEKEELCVA